MLTRLFQFLLVCVCLFQSTTALAADYTHLIGQQAMPKSGHRVMNGRVEIALETISVPYVIRDIKGDWLDVGPGYVHRAEVVTLDDTSKRLSNFQVNLRNSSENSDLRIGSKLGFLESRPNSDASCCGEPITATAEACFRS